MEPGKVSALVVFGATGDLAKLKTFLALVGLVGRGVLSAPVVGVGRKGWELEQFGGYAADSLRQNGTCRRSSRPSREHPGGAGRFQR